MRLGHGLQIFHKSICALIGFLYVFLASAQEGNAPKALRALEGQFRQIGLQACLPQVTELSKYLMSADDVNFVLQPIGPINAGSLTLSIAHINPSSKNKAFSTWTLRASGGDCSGTYEQVNHWPIQCSLVHTQEFSSYGPARILISGISQAELNLNTQVYFIPDISGCTTIKKELLP